MSVPENYHLPQQYLLDEVLSANTILEFDTHTGRMKPWAWYTF
jgi:hypothetical protein